MLAAYTYENTTNECQPRPVTNEKREKRERKEEPTSTIRPTLISHVVDLGFLYSSEQVELPEMGGQLESHPTATYIVHSIDQLRSAAPMLAANNKPISEAPFQS